MGRNKETTVVQNSQSQTYTPPQYVDDYNRAYVAAAQGQLPQQTALQNEAMKAQQNVYSAFANNTPLIGYLGQLQGISPEQTQSMVDMSLRDLYPQFQGLGILNSGAAASIASRTAADIRNQNAQFNVGALQNLLNLANTGQAQVQQPINQGNAIGSSRLAGLGTTTGSSMGNTSSYRMNPFLMSFQNTMGNGMGSMGTGFAGGMAYGLGGLL